MTVNSSNKKIKMEFHHQKDLVVDNALSIVDNALAPVIDNIREVDGHSVIQKTLLVCVKILFWSKNATLSAKSDARFKPKKVALLVATSLLPDIS